MNRRGKTVVTVLAIFGMVLLVGQSVGARGWGGGGYGEDCCNTNGPARQLSAEDQEAREKLTQETEELRREIIGTRAEYRALLSQENPAPDQVKKLAITLYDLHRTMHSKVMAAGLEQPGFASCDGPGQGHRRGGHMFGSDSGPDHMFGPGHMFR